MQFPDRLDTTQAEATYCAQAAADSSWLPMTVIRFEGQWQYVNALSTRVAKAETVVTLLPATFFN